MPQESATGNRVLSLLVLLTLALGLAAIYYHFGRDEPMAAGQKSRLRRPSSELMAPTYCDQAQIIAPTREIPGAPPPLPALPDPGRLPPDFPARTDASRASIVSQTGGGAARPLAQLTAPNADPAGDLPVVMGVLQRYLGRFKAYPAGDNRQVTNALTGNNPEATSFLPREHPAINKAGELTDRWGTPLFFHMIARDQLEIRSAGPDRQMYSADDLLEKSPSLRNPNPDPSTVVPL